MQAQLTENSGYRNSLISADLQVSFETEQPWGLRVLYI
jgi:hypothetical protein